VNLLLAICKIFYNKDEIRLVWPIITLIILIAASELLIVDPFGKILMLLGLTESPISNAHEWSPAIYELLKIPIKIYVF
jgi:hypothetical protein